MKAAAKRHQDEQAAVRAVATYGLPVEIDPHDALEQEVKRTAGHVKWLGWQVANLDRPTQVNEGPGGSARVDPNVLVELYQRERVHLVSVCKTAIAAGIDERRVQIAEAEGQLVADILRRTFDDPELGLSDEQRQKALQVGARHLRAV